MIRIWSVSLFNVAATEIWFRLQIRHLPDFSIPQLIRSVASVYGTKTNSRWSAYAMFKSLPDGDLIFHRPIRTEMAVTEFPARISAIHNIISLLRMANTSLMSMVIGGRFCLRNIICAIKPVMAIAFVCFRTLRHGIGVWSIMLRVLILKNVYLEVMQCPRSRFYASIVWKTNLTEVHLCCRKSGALIMSICLNCLIG